MLLFECGFLHNYWTLGFFLLFSFRVCCECPKLPIQIIFHLHIPMSLILRSSYFKMATIEVFGSFVPLTLPLQDDHHVKVSEDLFNLRFNLRIRSIYVEQEMYLTNGDILEIC